MEGKREMGRKEGEKRGRKEKGGQSEEKEGGKVSGEGVSQSHERMLCEEWIHQPLEAPRPKKGGLQ